jgi:hypothetical protein
MSASQGREPVTDLPGASIARRAPRAHKPRQDRHVLDERAGVLDHEKRRDADEQRREERAKPALI